MIDAVSKPWQIEGRRELKVRLLKDIYQDLTDPKFLSASEAAGYPKDEEEVIGVVYNGEVKAYPLMMVAWHHVINDVLGGSPISVSLCPLCGTSIVYKAEVEGQRIHLSTAGLDLDRVNLVMYDKATEGLWSQALGECLWGNYAGTKLQMLPSILTPWRKWMELYPHTLVVGKDTGYPYDYTQSYRSTEHKMTYHEYSEREYVPLPQFDRRYHPKEPTFGIDIRGVSKAYVWSMIERLKKVEDDLAGVPVILIVDVETKTVSVYSRYVNGKVLNFAGGGEGFVVDVQTKSKWNLAGLAIEGPLRGTSLSPIPFHRAFWFAWALAYPESQVYGI